MLPWSPGYFISNDGRMRGPRGFELSIQYSDKGFRRVKVNVDGFRRYVRIGRVVCWYHNGPPPDSKTPFDAAHIDGNIENDHAGNLEWRPHNGWEAA